ncbi:transposase, is4-like protein [Corallococcus coralloides]|uniref:Transposase, is4-like protein n=1 Tax=Corallococcus coralloides TaxID=184914 RepID=A0A410RMX4_CORCK|nr:transposase, is4-like protein [Corallococcus coralloides]
MLAAAERMVPREHLARKVLKLVKRFDLTRMEAGSSALGQRGYAPREVLALWVYASLIGIHQGTQLAHALQTDMALRLLSAGHAISRSVLNRFRASQGPFFTEALEETVRWASQEGLVEEQALAVDSVRLRAHASGRQVRVRKHSLTRLKALAQVDVRALSEPAQKHHDDEVQRHQQAVLLCQQRGAATVVVRDRGNGSRRGRLNGSHPLILQDWPLAAGCPAPARGGRVKGAEPFRFRRSRPLMLPSTRAPCSDRNRDPRG